MASSIDKIELLQSDADAIWRTRLYSTDDIGSWDDDVPAARVVFLTAAELKDNKNETKQRHERLQRHFQMSPAFWTKILQDASGFFKASEGIDAGGEGYHESWLRLLIKHPSRQAGSNRRLGEICYHWHRLSFFIRYRPDGIFTVLCFDLPKTLKDSIREALQPSRDFTQQPLAVHSFLMQHIIPLFDQQVWLCRDLVRAHEKSRPDVGRPKPEYADLHEIARHAIHSTEMLGTALNVIEAMLEEHVYLRTDRICEHRQVERTLRHQKTLLQGFHLRSAALEARLSNEMTLTYHLNSVHDSVVSTEIAHSAREDSAAMRMISFLGMMFLPGTFISAIFSMSFFDFNPPNDPTQKQVWRMSDKFWIFWAVSIPVIAVTITLWQTWMWYRAKRQLSPMSRHSTFVEKEPHSRSIGDYTTPTSPLRRFKTKLFESARSSDVEMASIRASY